MKKLKKDTLTRKEKKLTLNRETIKDLTLRTQVVGGALSPVKSQDRHCPV